MSQTKAKLSKIHTYAEDLESVRETQGHRLTPPKIIVDIPEAKITETKIVEKNTSTNSKSSDQILPTQAKPSKFSLTRKSIAKKGERPVSEKNSKAEKPKIEKVTKESPPQPKQKKEDPQKIITAATKNKTGEIRDNTYAATVITDNKHKRFRLIPAVFNALTEWWSAVTMQAHKKHQPKASIITDRHKGVVQKATSMTGRSSVADHNQTIARVKESAQKLVENKVKVPTATESDGEFKKHPAETKDEGRQEKEIPTTESNTEIVPDTLPKLLPEKEPELLIEEANEETVKIPVVTPPSWGDDDKAKEDVEIAKPEISEAKIEPIFPIIPELADVPVIPPKPEPEIHIFVSPNIEPIFPAQYDSLNDEEGEYGKSYAIPLSENRQTDDDFAIFEESENNEMYVSEPEPEPVAPTITELKNLLEEEERKVAETSAPIIPIPTRIVPERITPIIPSVLNNNQPIKPVSSAPQLQTEPIAATAKKTPSLKTANGQTKISQPTTKLINLLLRYKKLGIASIAIATVLSVGYLIYSNNIFPQINSTSEVTKNNLFRSSVVKTLVPTSITKEGIMRQLMGAKATDVTVTEIKLLTTFNGEPITGQILSDLLEFTIPAPSKANIESMSFGFYRNAPWILMTVRDAQSIRGGFLQWEVAMPQNLQPFFSVSASSNNSSRFIDGIVGDTDIRVMKNNNGQEEIMYGFIRHNTILITTDTISFLNLQENYTRQ